METVDIACGWLSSGGDARLADEEVEGDDAEEEEEEEK